MARSQRDEAVVVEEPLELRFDGEPFTTVMRSPGDDEELVRGLLLTEGFAASPDVIANITRPPNAVLSSDERGNVMEVHLTEPPAVAPRAHAVASSCGVCGKRAIAELEVRATPVRAECTVAAGVLVSLPDALRGEQAAFHSTGGLHAAGLFRPNGDLLVVREDVGRHNAVDKVVGWAVARAVAGDLVLCVSGRSSFEISQKAVVAGFAVVASVSAPTTLAIDVAERFRVTLCGFVRGTSFNTYSHSYRIVA